MFHIQHLCEGLSNTLIKVANGATTGRQKIQDKDAKGLQHGQDHEVMMSQALALEAQAHTLARDVKTLTQWLGRDVLALAGPSLTIRVELFDFVIAELLAREHLDPKRIPQVRVALQNQRDDLLSFAGVLDGKLEAIAKTNDLSMYLVRQACVLQRKSDQSPAYWEGWCRLCAQMGHKCHAVFESVIKAMAETPRCSSMVENLNSRLRNYFTLRRQLGGEYLSLLQFFLNQGSEVQWNGKPG